MEKIIRFSGRRPIPEKARVGTEGENNAEELKFVNLPVIDDSQVETLEIIAPDGSADAVTLVNHKAKLTSTHTQYTGLLTAYVQVQKSTDVIWRSEKFYLEILDLPDIDTAISQAYPSAIASALSSAAAYVQDAEAWAKGTRGGTAVGSSDDTYQKNAKYYRDQANTHATNANLYKMTAASNAATAEAWAKGTRNGEAVGSGDDTYHKNAKYYADSASTSATAAAGSATTASSKASDSEAFAVGTRGGNAVTSGDVAYNNFSKYYRTLAYSDAASAANSKKDAEAYAVGKRNGTDVGSSDAAYHNNAKYYAEQAAAAVTPVVLEITEEEGTGDAIIAVDDISAVWSAWNAGKRIFAAPANDENRFTVLTLSKFTVENVGTVYVAYMARHENVSGWADLNFVFTEEDGEYVGRIPS